MENKIKKRRRNHHHLEQKKKGSINKRLKIKLGLVVVLVVYFLSFFLLEKNK